MNNEIYFDNKVVFFKQYGWANSSLAVFIIFICIVFVLLIFHNMP